MTVERVSEKSDQSEWALEVRAVEVELGALGMTKEGRIVVGMVVLPLSQEGVAGSAGIAVRVTGISQEGVKVGRGMVGLGGVVGA